jgi:hypothetical protein
MQKKKKKKNNNNNNSWIRLHGGPFQSIIVENFFFPSLIFLLF